MKAVMNLTGIGQAMAYRYRHNAGEEHWVPSIYVPTAFIKLKHQFKDVLLKSLKDIETSPVVIAIKPLGWSTIQSILEDRQVGKMGIPDISKKYDVDAQVIEGFLKAARYLYKMRTRSTINNPKGKPRHRVEKERLPFPTRPTSTYDIAMTNRIFDRYSRSDRDKKEIIHAGIRHFVESYSPSSTDIRFRDKKAAKDYLSFLSSIGIKQDEIRLFHYRGKNTDESEASEQLNIWANYLKVPINQCRLISTPPGQSKNHGTIGIAIHSETGRTGKGKKAKKLKFTMPYGFRYAIYILYLVSNPKNSEQEN